MLFESLFKHTCQHGRGMYLHEPHRAFGHCSNWSSSSRSGLLSCRTSVPDYDITQCSTVLSSLHCQDSTMAEAEEQVVGVQEEFVEISDQ